MKKIEAKKHLFKEKMHFDHCNDDELSLPTMNGELQVAKLFDLAALSRDYRVPSPDEWIVTWLDACKKGDSVSSEQLLKMMSYGLGELENFVVPQAALNILYPLLMRESIIRIWQRAQEFMPQNALFSIV